MTFQLLTASPDATRAVGQAIAPLLRVGDVVSLTGDLGAGKTAFVQGAALGLGVGQAVLSPTFTLVREYEGRLRVYHLDVYRLERLQEVADLGFEEMLDRGVLFIEWGNAVEAILPEAYLEVDLTIGRDESARTLRLRGHGKAWAERWDKVRELVTPWAAAAR